MPYHRAIGASSRNRPSGLAGPGAPARHPGLPITLHDQSMSNSHPTLIIFDDAWHVNVLVPCESVWSATRELDILGRPYSALGA